MPGAPAALRPAGSRPHPGPPWPPVSGRVLARSCVPAGGDAPAPPPVSGEPAAAGTPPARGECRDSCCPPPPLWGHSDVASQLSRVAQRVRHLEGEPQRVPGGCRGASSDPRCPGGLPVLCWSGQAGTCPHGTLTRGTVGVGVSRVHRGQRRGPLTIRTDTHPAGARLGPGQGREAAAVPRQPQSMGFRLGRGSPQEPGRETGLGSFLSSGRRGE